MEVEPLRKLRNHLQRSGNLASPPALAMRIVELLTAPDVDMTEVTAVISNDPGLTAKMLRVANSGMYAQRRKSANLRQALIALGLNAATTIALSFSLLDHYRTVKGAGIDYGLYWRRSLLGATVARSLAGLACGQEAETIFLAGLLQDIAILAIDRADPAFYRALPLNASHADLLAYERSALSSDHAALGGWLMRGWRLPESLCAMVEASHSPIDDAALATMTPAEAALRCIAQGARCADLLLQAPDPSLIAEFCSSAAGQLGLGAGEVFTNLEGVIAQIPEIERLFDVSLLGPDAAVSLLEQAQELMAVRTLQALEQVQQLEARSQALDAYKASLEEKSRRDELTGVFNRGFLDSRLEQEFASCRAGRWPLSVIFLDIDHFKRINDTYGHAAGDLVLKSTALVLVDVMRDTDVVARYGGEEFLILLPGVGSEAAIVAGERLLARLRANAHRVDGATLHVTASLGLVTHSADTPFECAGDLIRAADQSMYVAKHAGRDRLVVHDTARSMARATGSSNTPAAAIYVK